MTLVAYRRIGEGEGFGFLNSGWGRPMPQEEVIENLTWISEREMERYIQEYPTFFIRPHFVVITALR